MRLFRDFLAEIDTRSTLEKLQALHARAGTPGEKAAAKAAIERHTASQPDVIDPKYATHEQVLKAHGFTQVHGPDYNTYMNTGASHAAWKRGKVDVRLHHDSPATGVRGYTVDRKSWRKGATSSGTSPTQLHSHLKMERPERARYEDDK